MGFEIIALIAVALLVLSGCFIIYDGRATSSSFILLAISLLMCCWMIGAYIWGKPTVVDITYHTVGKQQAIDGPVVDVILVTDTYGVCRVVNLNSQLGIKVPEDGDYKIARIQYSRQSWGLVFNQPPRYRLFKE